MTDDTLNALKELSKKSSLSGAEAHVMIREVPHLIAELERHKKALGTKIIQLGTMNRHVEDLEAEVAYLKLSPEQKFIKANKQLAVIMAEANLMRAALAPLSEIPIEKFDGYDNPEKQLMAWNDHAIFSADVYAARAARKLGT